LRRAAPQHARRPSTYRAGSTTAGAADGAEVSKRPSTAPPEDYGRLKRWCGYRAGLTFGRPRPEEQVEHAENIVAYRGYLRGLVQERVERRTGDLTSALIDIHDEDPEAFTLDEIA
jgi:hypothetical protein